MRSERYTGRMARALQNVLFLIILASIVTGACAQEKKDKPQEQKKPLNEFLTTAAWDAFNAGKFENAITNADKCVEEFRGAANRIQTKLEKDKATVPNGAVTEDEKKKINENALLNDVATCLFIKGRSAEGLKRKDDAKKAYKAAAKYTYARAWDPKGWFWSPAEAASDRLGLLE